MSQFIPIGQRFLKMESCVDEDDGRCGRYVRDEMEQYGAFSAETRDHSDVTKRFEWRKHPREKVTGIKTRQRVVLPIKVDRKAVVFYWIRLHRAPHTKLIEKATFPDDLRFY
jgi:hypothetical protein